MRKIRQADEEALVQCSLDDFCVHSLNFGRKWREKMVESGLYGR